jgi:microcystin-dependent protein
MAANPFLGEIKIVSFNFPPKGWAFCNGQFLPINQNQALFSLLGTTYGGNGQTTFALPNLQGRVPIMTGNGFNLGGLVGEYNHTLINSEMPAHIHPMFGTAATANNATPGATATQGVNTSVAQGRAVATGQPQVTIFGTGSPTKFFAANAITATGGNQPHTNQQPLLVLNFCIALQGIFPSQN